MNAQRLYLAGEVETHYWICGKCQQITTRQDWAENCCVYKCADCGVEVKRYSRICDACDHLRDVKKWEEKFATAPRIAAADYPDDWCVWSPHLSRWYNNLEHAIDDLFDDPNRPPYFEAAKQKRVSADAEGWIEHIEENLELEDSEDFLQGTDELIAFATEWEKQQQPVYAQSDSIIVIDWEAVDADNDRRIAADLAPEVPK